LPFFEHSFYEKVSSCSYRLQIIDKILIFSDIDKIFVELFKKANDFEIYIEHLKRSRKFKYNF